MNMPTPRDHLQDSAMVAFDPELGVESSSEPGLASFPHGHVQTVLMLESV
jgi:hypothetical protein